MQKILVSSSSLVNTKVPGTCPLSCSSPAVLSIPLWLAQKQTLRALQPLTRTLLGPTCPPTSSLEAVNLTSCHLFRAPNSKKVLVAAIQRVANTEGISQRHRRIQVVVLSTKSELKHVSVTVTHIRTTRTPIQEGMPINLADGSTQATT